MEYTVLDCFEKSVLNFADRAALTDDASTINYSELKHKSRCGASVLGHKIHHGQPIAVYAKKSKDSIIGFLSIIYAGGCYSYLNPELPESRLKQICDCLDVKIILTDAHHREKAQEMFSNCEILDIEELTNGKEDEELLNIKRAELIDTDPLYINFTSGSTGVPKGIAVSHRSVIDFIKCFTEIFEITENDIIGNQAPFDFDVSVKDIYSAFFTGAELVVIPRELFSLPTKLMDFLCEHKVSILVWAVSALSLLKTFHALEYKTPETVRKVLFSGEVMQYKVLKYLREQLPSAEFVNLYGPTEITCNCTYHILSAERDYAEGIPIGIPFPNEDVFLLSDDDKLIIEKETAGEVCVRGTALALGYFLSPQENEKHFTQNPLNKFYPERIYRTGDLAQYDENGELVFCGRKDFQIKYMGHRIELEEIERRMSEIDGVEQSCCVFDEAKQKLKGFYIGDIESADLLAVMKQSLPMFMVPGRLHKLDSFPLNKNGKIDRKVLKELKVR